MTEPTLNYVPCPDASGGHRMAYWQWGDATAGHVVVCVHGLSRQGRDFDVLAQALVARSPHPLRVLCPDVVGRGRSDWLQDPMGYQVPLYAADMLAMLRQAHAQAPIALLDWVGTSMGGLIGMALAGTPDLPLPAPIRRMVLNDVGPAVSWDAIRRIQAYIGDTGRFADLQEAAHRMREISQGFGPHTEEQWLALSRPMVRALPEGGLTLHYDPALGMSVRAVTPELAAQGEALLWAAYDRITARVLVTRGATSDLLLPTTVQAMEQRGPRARRVEFEGVGHAPTFVARDQVEVVASFLLSADHEEPRTPAA